MSSQMDFAARLGRIESGERRIISRVEMADPNAANSTAKQKRVELLDIGGRKPVLALSLTENDSDFHYNAVFISRLCTCSGRRYVCASR